MLKKENKYKNANKQNRGNKNNDRNIYKIDIILYLGDRYDMILIIKEKPFINVISVLKRENNKICVQEGKSFRTMMFIQ